MDGDILLLHFFKNFTLMNGYYLKEESRHDPINIAGVVVVTRVPIGVDIHEVGRITQIRRTLPPIDGTNSKHQYSEYHLYN